MRSFAKFLAGEGNKNTDIPQYLDLRYSTDGGAFWDTYLIKTIPVSGKTVGQDGDDWVATFDARISVSSLLQEVSGDDPGKFKLVLQSGVDENGNQKNPVDLAEIPVTAAQVARITPGTSALVKWTMKVVNKGEEE